MTQKRKDTWRRPGSEPLSVSSSACPATDSPPSAVPEDDHRSLLPVMALRDKIVTKIMENRVTLIVGDTGCGKSSQVPQFLLEEDIYPIMCTQPRRFAVVAIARMVAKARKVEVGSEVGYHIGHSNVSDIGSRSKIVFKTAGVVLEQIRDKGLAALKHKVIILDEVHERSVESDVLLACVKQFMMKNQDLRIVLMSATVDITRYRDYFNDLGRGERLEVIAIPSASRHSIFQRKVMYLDQVAEILGTDEDSLSASCCPSHADADMEHEMHVLIHKLILYITDNERDVEKSILVFLPTYYSLEQQWLLLRHYTEFFKIHILHRSIETDQALLAMKVCKSRRKVILATNIAESSVTIPGVAYVIDSCRFLQVCWNSKRKVDSYELQWVSKSQAEQRKGRTGRTCDGQIYRLVTRQFYNKLQDHEYPAIKRLSLRQQILMICCSDSRAINEPKVLLQKVLDPPDPERVEDALSLLVHIGALDKSLSYRGHYRPTYYGRLLDSLPLSFEASMLILKFGEIGLVQEGVIIGILMDVQPLPVLQPFGSQNQFKDYLDNYFQSDYSSISLTGKREILFMGNLCAYQFWQRIFKDKHRLERLTHGFKEAEVPEELISMVEQDWCLSHNLVLTSLHNVSEICEDVFNILHSYRPNFMIKLELPSYFEPYFFKHSCLLQYDLLGKMDALALEEDYSEFSADRMTCISEPYVSSYDFQAKHVGEKLKTVVQEIRIKYNEPSSINLSETVNDASSRADDSLACRFFLSGICNKGNQCGFSHSLQARRPICKFFLTLQGCRNGGSCIFSHDNGSSIATAAASRGCSQEDENPSPHCFLQMLPCTDDGRVLVLNDKDLIISAKLSEHYNAKKIVAMTPCAYSESSSLSSDVEVIWGISDPCLSIIRPKETLLPWKQVKCVLFFADIDISGVPNLRHFMKKLFENIAIRILAETSFDMKLIITMNNLRFSQLQVEKLARESFFFLSESFPFDESTFGNFTSPSGNARPGQVNEPITYIFNICPPAREQFGDYSAEIQSLLYN